MTLMIKVLILTLLNSPQPIYTNVFELLICNKKYVIQSSAEVQRLCVPACAHGLCCRVFAVDV